MKKSSYILAAVLAYLLLLFAAFFIIRNRIITKDIQYKWELQFKAGWPMGQKEKLYDVVFNDSNVKLVLGEKFSIKNGLTQNEITWWHRTNDGIKQVYDFVPRYDRDVEWPGWCIHVLEALDDDYYYDYLLYPIAIGVHRGFSLSERQLKSEIQNYLKSLSSKESDMSKQDDETDIIYKDITRLHYANKYYSFISAKHYVKKNTSPYDSAIKLFGPDFYPLDGIGPNQRFLGQYHSENILLPPKENETNKFDYHAVLDNGVTVLFLYRKDLDAHTIMYRHYDKPMEKEFLITSIVVFSVLSFLLILFLLLIKRKFS